jgi:hypothetical protein
MATLKQFDVLLGESLEDLMAALQMAMKVPDYDAAGAKRKIARVVSELWEIREALYARDPSIRPEVFESFESDPKTHGVLLEKLGRAHDAEAAGHVDEALQLYLELSQNSRLRVVRVEAEAGLFRLSAKAHPSS